MVGFNDQYTMLVELIGAEVGYPCIEQLAFALVVTTRKLLPYPCTFMKGQILVDFIAEFTSFPEEIEYAQLMKL